MNGHDVAYRVTDRDGNEIRQNDTVTDFRGNSATFSHVVGNGEFPDTYLIRVREINRDLYSSVYRLTVKEYSVRLMSWARM